MTKTYLKDLTPEEVVRRLKNGEKVYTENTTYHYFKMIDGVICRFDDDGDIVYGCQVFSEARTDERRYFETEKPFKINHIGLYKTRDGRKAFVAYVSQGFAFGFIESEAHGWSWHVDNGHYLASGTLDRDIVSEWS